MKSILLSVRHLWVEKILNGTKTIELRNSKPRLPLPIDVYIYCTKAGNTTLSGKVVAKFTLKNVERIKPHLDENLPCQRVKTDTMMEEELLERSRVLPSFLYTSKYAWHISDLEVFKEPKDLLDFKMLRSPESWAYIEVTEQGE